MFENIGEKIKIVATIATVIGIIFSIISGLALIIEEEIFPGLATMIVGSLVAWIGSFILYGFGEIIEQLTEANANSKKLYALLQNQTNTITKISTTEKPASEKSTEKSASDRHLWRCDNCGKLVDSHPCPFCNK